MADDDSVVVLSDSGESGAPSAGAGAGAGGGGRGKHSKGGGGGGGGDDGDDGDGGGGAGAGGGGGGGQWWNKRMDVLDDEAAEELAAVEERTFPQADPPPGLSAELLPFQRESLYWMVRQERSGYRGGILADVSVPRLGGAAQPAGGPVNVGP
jgi:hypothetical protein